MRAVAGQRGMVLRAKRTQLHSSTGIFIAMARGRTRSAGTVNLMIDLDFESCSKVRIETPCFFNFKVAPWQTWTWAR